MVSQTVQGGGGIKKKDIKHSCSISQTRKNETGGTQGKPRRDSPGTRPSYYKDVQRIGGRSGGKKKRGGGLIGNRTQRKSIQDWVLTKMGR